MKGLVREAGDFSTDRISDELLLISLISTRDTGRRYVTYALKYVLSENKVSFRSC